MRRFAAALALAAGAAAAQDGADPRDYATKEEAERFRICRAAVFYHLDGPEDPAATVPRPVARALLDQMEFIMAESLLNKSFSTIEEGQRLVAFTEGFFIDFNRTIARQREAMEDLARREAVLMDCVPWIWVSARSMIDYLVKWRARAVNAPALPTPAERGAEADRLDGKLGIGK